MVGYKDTSDVAKKAAEVCYKDTSDVAKKAAEVAQKKEQ